MQHQKATKLASNLQIVWLAYWLKLSGFSKLSCFNCFLQKYIHAEAESCTVHIDDRNLKLMFPVNIWEAPLIRKSTLWFDFVLDSLNSPVHHGPRKKTPNQCIVDL